MSLLLSLLFYLAVAIVVILVVGTFITFLVERSPYQKQFVQGRIPTPAPQGFYPGMAHVLFDKPVPWLGKSFDSTGQFGFNIFTPLGARILKVFSPLYRRFNRNAEGNTNAYYFKTRTGQGKKDPQTEVIKLDYDAPENPLFIRIILDEIVEIAPQQYLGKIHVKMLPGFYVTIGYFGLRKQ